jgi:hypothetical protein
MIPLEPLVSKPTGDGFGKIGFSDVVLSVRPTYYAVVRRSPCDMDVRLFSDKAQLGLVPAPGFQSSFLISRSPIEWPRVGR